MKSQHSRSESAEVGLAIDLIQLTYEAACDVAIIVSQDWDFGTAVRLARTIAHDRNRALAKLPSPAAVVNAIYHATGKRVRDLPITLDRLL